MVLGQPFVKPMNSILSMKKSQTYLTSGTQKAYNRPELMSGLHLPLRVFFSKNGISCQHSQIRILTKTETNAALHFCFPEPLMVWLHSTRFAVPWQAGPWGSPSRLSSPPYSCAVPAQCMDIFAREAPVNEPLSSAVESMKTRLIRPRPLLLWGPFPSLPIKLYFKYSASNPSRT